MAKIDLTAVQRRLLSALCQKPDQLQTRSEIAEAAGYNRLNYYRIQRLHDMADDGLLIVDETTQGEMTYYSYKPTAAGCEAVSNS